MIMIDWFTPGYKAGGPIQSCANIAFALKDEYEVYVLTTDTDHGENLPYTNIIPNQWTTDIDPLINIYYAQKKELTTQQLAKEIDRVQPDYIYLNNVFSPYFVLYPLWLKCTGKIKSKVIICPRGSLYDSALSVKKYKKKPFLILFKWLGIHKKVLFHATNDREKEAILQHFPGSKIRIADNLPNINQPQFVSCNKEAGGINCIFVARIVAIKNLLFLLDILEKVRAIVKLTIVGPIEDNTYWEECKNKITQLPSNINIDYVGTKPNNQLMKIIQQHHLFVLPTTGENFGHAIFEAMLSGRPVLISDQTPWLRLNEKKTGWDIPLNNTAAFINAIEEAASWDQRQFDEYANATWSFANKFVTNPALREQYNELFA
jgi:glycosyltransferase involved in cell wall biosynthesis